MEAQIQKRLTLLDRLNSFPEFPKYNFYAFMRFPRCTIHAMTIGWT